MNHINYLRAFSTIFGIIRASKGAESSKHGLVFTSIIQGLKFWSIMKSNPNTYG